MAEEAVVSSPARRSGNAPVYKITNFHIVAPGIIRTAQPSEEGFQILKEYCGIKTVLNLHDNAKKIAWEKDVTEKLGIEFINIPMNAKYQEIEKIERCLDIITDKKKQPVLVHCVAGKDRTGLVIGAYRIKYDNWSLEDTFKEMLAYGYFEGFSELTKSLETWHDYVKSQQVLGKN